MRPLLPTADALLPYLRRIDAARVYSNWGPLVEELEQRLATCFGLPAGTVVSANSGTSALMAATLAVAGPATSAKPFAIVPSYTFVATAVALALCGYRCFLADIDPESWALDPTTLADRIDGATLAQAGLVMPVAPYGRTVDVAAWRKFREHTGIPVVIDAAASIESALRGAAELISEIPVVLSLHATKSLATAEGGLAVSTNAELVARIGEALNFGFRGSRESFAPSLNGKLSEYHAAVGLAELDGWLAKEKALGEVVRHYRAAAGRAGLTQRFTLAPDVSSNYVLFLCADAGEARRVAAALTRNAVDHRLWYGLGLHRHAQFADLPRAALDQSESIAPRLIGLPMAMDLSPQQVARVVEAIAEGLSR